MQDRSSATQRLGGVSRGVLLVLLLIAAPASAQNLNLDAVAAAIALPILTDVDRNVTTTIAVTNHSSSAALLHLQAISGDPGDHWQAASFSCLVTAHETTKFFVRGLGEGSEIKFECSTPGATEHSRPEDLNVERSEITAARQGILWVALARTNGDMSSNNFLTGEAVVREADAGLAYHLPGVPFRGGDPLSQDGNLEFRFDGLEYAQFPSVLTTEFHAPTSVADGAGGFLPGITGKLILFTLDGTVGAEQTPRARLKVNFYNDDERLRDTAFEFDCFAVIDLEQLDARFHADALGSRTGHLELVPQPTSNPNLAHDLQFDGPSPDGVRTAPVHGWLVQTIPELATLSDKGGPLGPTPDNPAAWARVLGQSGFSVSPSPGDVPVLNAQ